eukprot:TRINITY_DN8640_c0_g1_i3.p2 TRINITY_DN8640_c0_g1~~TRINITY_DN8640_c0_g1_i3.p2  ORF type:complete len:138 (+),score=26.01 TRINITY_DN8640_c0_g1_i3:185-598(+)
MVKMYLSATYLVLLNSLNLTSVDSQPLVQQHTSANSNDDCINHHACYHENSTKFGNVLTLQKCWDLCDNDAACYHFTYYTNGVCHLFEEKQCPGDTTNACSRQLFSDEPTNCFTGRRCDDENCRTRCHQRTAGIRMG